MKLHLQCAEQHDSPSNLNLTKYCTDHGKWHAWLIIVTYETSFMRGATSITLQPHKILRLPRKTAFRNLREICRKQLKRHSECVTDPSMIRTRSGHELVISHPPVRRGYFSHFGDAFSIENYNISGSGYLPKFHRILHRPRKVTLRHHQIVRLRRLPRKELLLDWSVTSLHSYFSALLLYWTVKLLLYWAVTSVNCYFTELLLYWSVTLLSCYFTELFCSFTGLFAFLNLRNLEVSQLNFLW